MFNMNGKNKRVISIIIIAVLILAMVVPSLLAIVGQF